MHVMMVYIRLFSGAGLVSEHKLSYKKLEEAVRPFIGQQVLMAAHPFVNGQGGGLNTTYVDKESSTWIAFTAAANHDGTSILCMEQNTWC